MEQAIQELIDSVRKPGCCYESETIRQLRPLLEELVIRRREDGPSAKRFYRGKDGHVQSH